MNHCLSFLFKRALPTFAVITLLANCIAASSRSCQAAEVKSIQLASSDFRSNQAIPKPFTADGADNSPALTWNGAPSGAKTFALICHDPDAPNGNWVHWVAYNIPATSVSLARGAGAPTNTAFKQGTNSFRKIGWNGPSPPAGKAHRYIFDIYALNSALADLRNPTDDQLKVAMRGHILAKGQVIGLYQR